MRLKLKNLHLSAGRPIAFLHKKTAKKLNMHINGRLEISFKGKSVIARVDLSNDIVKPGEIALSKRAINHLDVKPGKEVDVNLITKPASIQFILKKLNGETLKENEIKEIVEDIVDNSLTEAEISYFVSGVYHHGMNFQETVFLTKSMRDSGQKLSWNSNKIADKHSIGGVAGNRTTPIVISICASLGVKMPKTSSRAITSAAGTADVIEVLSNIDFSANFLKKVVQKTGACLAWNGSFSLSPADDKLIQIEKLLGLDPRAQLLASIMSKKLAVGSKYVLIDIPFGKGAKVSKKEALVLKKQFQNLAKQFKVKMKVVLTNGSQPIGHGIGPILEVKDVLHVLMQDNSPKDLEEKSVFLAGELLELVGKAKKGKGKEKAKEALRSGKAYKKFKEIINAQGGSIAPEKLSLGKFKKEIKSPRSGKIKSIDNKKINWLARILGCPTDKAAGIYLHKHARQSVRKGEPTLTLYSQSRKKLNAALEYYTKNKPIEIS